MKKIRKGFRSSVNGIRQLLFVMVSVLMVFPAMAEQPVVKKIFIFGDSMTGWMAERLQAYGEKNGFVVDALIWDGATMKKYADSSAALAKQISAARPDAVFVCLGLNEMASPNPEKQLGGYLQKILTTIGDYPVIWIGPCSWPGHPDWGPVFDKWLSGRLGSAHYFNSLDLKLTRQGKTNPHPDRKGINIWTDDIIKWIESGEAAVRLPGYAVPAKEFSRPKVFIYRKMKAPL
ncbi:MAG: SGNH/GDSL hydrolase family protein [Muribaculaceae bacterium]|nr:SGNH/GDSL hydrolase family protein [Muribaculaceae bacterium]